MYEHDIFLSYKRHKDWNKWHCKHLVDLLKKHLYWELKVRDPSIFIDVEIKPASDWPHKIGLALARSRILIPCFSSKYFESPWCTLELNLMLSRRMRNNNPGIVWPLIVHNCDQLPGDVGKIQARRLDPRFFNPDIVEGSQVNYDFSEEIKYYSTQIPSDIDSAPTYDPQWEVECIQRFEELYASPSGKTDEQISTENKQASTGTSSFFPSVQMS